MKRRICSFLVMACIICAMLPPAVAVADERALQVTMGGVTDWDSGISGSTLAINAQNELWAWGANNYGQLGDGTTTSTLYPVKVMDDVKFVSTYQGHTMAIKTNGELWGWGRNEYGQLGDGTTTDSNKPIKIMDDIACVSVGNDFTLAVNIYGEFWAWGSNTSYQLGIIDWSVKTQLVPALIMDGVKSVTAEGGRFLINTNDELWTWGSRYDNDIFKYEFAKVMDNVKSVSARGQTMVVKTNGELWGWGDNWYGAVGNGTNRNTVGNPVKIMSDVKSVSAGNSFTMAIKTNNELWGWGSNNTRDLGDGTNIDKLEPVKIMDNVASVSAYNGTRVIKTDGELWAWGQYSIIGDGSDGSWVPVKIWGSSEPSSYMIKYDANGGRLVTSIISWSKWHDVPHQITFLLPWRGYHTFLGWSTYSDATEAEYQPGDFYEVNTETTFYAVWEVNTNIILYSANGGTGVPERQIKIQNQAINLSETIPTRTGYTFLGWSTNSTSATAEYQPGDVYNKDVSITLYAIWKANTYTISYNTNGGVGTISPQTKAHDRVLTLSSVVPTRSGYTFIGWSEISTATSASYSAGGSFNKNATTTLYAVWRQNTSTYIVSYNANGGSGAPANQSKVQNITLTLSRAVPTRSGYTFLGWATSSSATTAEYQPGGSYTANASVTLYAVWSQDSKFALNVNAYNFSNSRSSFGYSSSYRIPLERYQEVFGPVEGKSRYDRGGYWGGSCFGFASTTGLFFTGTLSVSNYGANSVYNIEKPGSTTKETTKLLERFQISQGLSGIYRQYNYNISDLIDAVTDFQNTGQKPVLIGMFGAGSGHAVIGYAIKQDATGYTVSLYDNNFPNKERILKISSDKKSWSNSDYTGYNSASGGDIMFVYTNVVGENMMNHLNENKLFLNVSTSDVNIYNSSGVHVDDIEGAHRIYTFDNQVHDDISYSLPEDTYSVIPTRQTNPLSMSMGAKMNEPFTVSLSDKKTYVAASNATAFESEITLGDRPKLDIGKGVGDFNLSVTSSNRNFTDKNVNVYKTGEDSFTIAILNEELVPEFGSAIEFASGNISTDLYETKTLGITFVASEMDFAININGAPDKQSGLNYTVTNNSAGDQNATLILAVYDAENKLCKLETTETLLTVGENNLSFSLDDVPGGAHTLQLFCWDSLESMIPLSTTKSSNLY